MLKGIIIDDELKGRIALKQKLLDYCEDVEVVAEATSGEEGIALISKFRPHIIFLDIEMPRMDGFEMLRNMETKDFHIIFTTAYDQYAIKAIRYSAFDYLLKPVDIEELRSAIKKIRLQTQDNTVQKLRALEENLRPGLSLNKIVIPTLDGILFLTSTTSSTWKRKVIIPPSISPITQR